jgi:hypothetical protein
MSAVHRIDVAIATQPALLCQLSETSPACDVMMAEAEAKVQYSAILLGATANVGGRIVQFLINNPLRKKLVVVTRRKMDAFADPNVSEVVVNMDRLEDEVASHAQEVEVALAAIGIGKGSAKMPDEEVRKIEMPTHRRFVAPPRLQALVYAGS